jgi:hypothetical protein
MSTSQSMVNLTMKRTRKFCLSLQLRSNRSTWALAGCLLAVSIGAASTLHCPGIVGRNEDLFNCRPGTGACKPVCPLGADTPVNDKGYSCYAYQLVNPLLGWYPATPGDEIPCPSECPAYWQLGPGNISVECYESVGACAATGPAGCSISAKLEGTTWCTVDAAAISQYDYYATGCP